MWNGTKIRYRAPVLGAFNAATANGDVWDLVHTAKTLTVHAHGGEPGNSSSVGHESDVTAGFWAPAPPPDKTGRFQTQVQLDEEFNKVWLEPGLPQSDEDCKTNPRLKRQVLRIPNANVFPTAVAIPEV